MKGHSRSEPEVPLMRPIKAGSSANLIRGHFELCDMNSLMSTAYIATALKRFLGERLLTLIYIRNTRLTNFNVL